MRTVVGSMGYQAPEVIGCVETEKTGQYDANCDVWSFGCVLYELCTGQVPFGIYDIRKLLRYQESLSHLRVAFLQDDAEQLSSSPDFKRLIKYLAENLLEPSPKIRCTSRRALQEFLRLHLPALLQEAQSTSRSTRTDQKSTTVIEERNSQTPAVSPDRHVKPRSLTPPLSYRPSSQPINDAVTSAFHQADSSMPPNLIHLITQNDIKELQNHTVVTPISAQPVQPPTVFPINQSDKASSF